MNRRLQTAAVIAGMLAATPAVAGDLVVDVAPPAADSPSRAYATFFAGGTRSSAAAEFWVDGDGFAGVGGEVEDGYIVGAAVGTEVLPHLRGEAEFSVVMIELGIVDDDAVDSIGYNLLGNLWYDVDTGTSFTPYVGGGVGWSHNVLTDGVDEETISGFVYQLGAGVRFAATENIGFDLGYRYRVLPSAGTSMDLGPDAELKVSATTHIVQGGVTVGF